MRGLHERGVIFWANGPWLVGQLMRQFRFHY
jgi:hypothetical protein